MLGHIEEWFYAGLAGIRPRDAGLRRILVQPEPVGDLTWVNAKWETFRGPVTVNWKLTGGALHVHVGLPPGMDADVVLPGSATPRTAGAGETDFTVPFRAPR